MEIQTAKDEQGRVFLYVLIDIGSPNGAERVILGTVSGSKTINGRAYRTMSP